jgi:hypothetical protein
LARPPVAKTISIYEEVMVEIGRRDGEKKCDESDGPLLEMRMPVRAYVLALRDYPKGHCEVESAFFNDCANVFGEGR